MFTRGGETVTGEIYRAAFIVVVRGEEVDDDDCDESSLGNKRGLKTKKTTVGSIEMHEFYRPFLRKKCLHRFTSVAGHVCSIDFPDKFQDWDLDPKLLFDCKTEKKVTAGRIRGV